MGGRYVVHHSLSFAGHYTSFLMRKRKKILQSLDAFLFIVISTSFATFSTRRCTFIAVLHRFPAAVTSDVAPFSFIRLRGRQEGLWAGGFVGGGYVVHHFLATIHHF